MQFKSLKSSCRLNYIQMPHLTAHKINIVQGKTTCRLLYEEKHFSVPRFIMSQQQSKAYFQQQKSFQEITFRARFELNN